MKALRLVAIIAATSSLLIVETTAAAPPQPPSAPAQELARLLVSKENWALGLQQIAAGVKQNLEGHPGSKQYPSDLPSRIRTEVEGVLPYDDLVAMHAKQLSASYSEPELNDLSAFFRTPAGKKWLETQPKISEAVARAMQQRFDEKMPEVIRKLVELAKHPAPAKTPAKSSKKPSK